MTLVDTSVWVQHLRTGQARLVSLLDAGEVLSHPFVFGELACGNLRDRSRVLGLLAALPEAPMATHPEVLHLLETKRLYGRGLGWVDIHLLASCMLAHCNLWTLDFPLLRAAAALDIMAR